MINSHIIQNFCCEIATKARQENLKEFFDRFKNQFEIYEQVKTYSQSDFRNDVTTFDQVKRILGRKWYYTLEHTIYPFLHHLHFTTSNQCIVERPISTFNKKLIDTIGSQQNVSNARSKMVELDCLKCVQDSYWFGKKEFDWYAPDGGISHGLKSKYDTKCQIFIINKKMVDWLYNICAELYGKLDYNHQDSINVELKESKTVLKNANVDSSKFVDKLRVGSKLNFDVRKFGVDKGGKKGTEGRKVVQALVNEVITQKHPFIKHYMSLRKELNKNLPERARGVFELNCHYSASGCHLVKIGIRDSNDCCNLKAHHGKEIVETENGFESIPCTNDKYKGEWFGPVAKSILGTTEYYENDVKSSVPRVLWLLKNGEWLSEKTDIYEIVLGSKFESKLSRDCFKRFVLMALFSSSVDEMIRNIKPAFSSVEWNLKKDNVAESICYIKNRLDQLFGHVSDTIVFAHESAIYMEVEKVLQQRGIKYIKKFDCFYTDVPVDDIESVIQKCAIKYYQTWIKGSNVLKEEKKVVCKEGRTDNTKIGFSYLNYTSSSMKTTENKLNSACKTIVEIAEMLI